MEVPTTRLKSLKRRHVASEFSGHLQDHLRIHIRCLEHNDVSAAAWLNGRLDSYCACTTSLDRQGPQRSQYVRGLVCEIGTPFVILGFRTPSESRKFG